MARRRIATLFGTILVVIAWGTLAQQPAPQGGAGRGPAAGRGARPTRPPLFFREEWKQTPANDEHPVTAESVANASLELKLYGPSAKEIQLTGSVKDESNPIHVWTGMCTSPCGLTFRHKTSYADLTGLARIRWVTKMSGFHQVRPLVKLADGTYLVADRADGSPIDWLVSDISFAELRWRRLDSERVVTVGDWVSNPNLGKVDEIGFVDLMPGSGHGQGGWSDVATIEVYGKAVGRENQ